MALAIVDLVGATSERSCSILSEGVGLASEPEEDSMALWNRSWLRLLWLAFDNMVAYVLRYVAVERDVIARCGCERLQNWTIWRKSREVVCVSRVEWSRVANLVLANPSDFGLEERPDRTRTTSEAWIRSEESYGR